MNSTTWLAVSDFFNHSIDCEFCLTGLDVTFHTYALLEPMDPPPLVQFPKKLVRGAGKDMIIFEYIHRWAQAHGYDLKVKMSHRDRNIYFRCIQWNRITGGCPFDVAAYCSPANQVWTLSVRHAGHNHPPSHPVSNLESNAIPLSKENPRSSPLSDIASTDDHSPHQARDDEVIDVDELGEQILTIFYVRDS